MFNNVYVITIFGLMMLGLIRCAMPSNEMETISKDTLKYKQGVEIEVKPIPKDGH